MCVCKAKYNIFNIIIEKNCKILSFFSRSTSSSQWILFLLTSLGRFEKNSPQSGSLGRRPRGERSIAFYLRELKSTTGRASLRSKKCHYLLMARQQLGRCARPVNDVTFAFCGRTIPILSELQFYLIASRRFASAVTTIRDGYLKVKDVFIARAAFLSRHFVTSKGPFAARQNTFPGDKPTRNIPA